MSAQRLEESPLTLDRSRQVAVEIADALNTADRQYCQHRSLKPGNIILAKIGVTRLDLELANRRPSDVIGTVGGHLGVWRVGDEMVTGAKLWT